MPGFQPSAALPVGLAVGMLAAVGLDRDVVFKAGEIEDVRPHGMLAAKLVLAEPPPA